VRKEEEVGKNYLGNFFYCGKKHNIKFIILTILRIHFSSVKYIYIVMQKIFKTLRLAKWKLASGYCNLSYTGGRVQEDCDFWFFFFFFL
jgi:hypothetical protein